MLPVFLTTRFPAGDDLNDSLNHTLLKSLLAFSLMLLLGIGLCAENASGVFSEILAFAENLIWLQKAVCGCLFAILLSGQFVYPATFWLGSVQQHSADAPAYPESDHFPEPDTTLRDRFCRSNLSRAPSSGLNPYPLAG